MPTSRSMHSWLRLPSRIALLLGLGALSAAGGGTEATATPADSRSPQWGSGDLLIRTDGGRIYVSEGGGEFWELQSGGPSHARLLQQLLRHDGAGAGAPVRLSPMILAGSGGNSIHWGPPRKTGSPGQGKAATPGATDSAGTSGSPKPAEQRSKNRPPLAQKE